MTPIGFGKTSSYVNVGKKASPTRKRRLVDLGKLLGSTDKKKSNRRQVDLSKIIGK